MIIPVRGDEYQMMAIYPCRLSRLLKIRVPKNSNDSIAVTSQKERHQNQTVYAGSSTVLPLLDGLGARHDD